MQAETHHPLEPFFQQMVRNSYAGKLGIHDTAITEYVAHLLCEFSEADKLYKVHDEEGRPIRTLEELLTASDPIHGTAPSFDAERAVRAVMDVRCATLPLPHQMLGHTNNLTFRFRP